MQAACLSGSLRLRSGQDWQKSLPATSSSTEHVGLLQWDGQCIYLYQQSEKPSKCHTALLVQKLTRKMYMYTGMQMHLLYTCAVCHLNILQGLLGSKRRVRWCMLCITGKHSRPKNEATVARTIDVMLTCKRLSYKQNVRCHE